MKLVGLAGSAMVQPGAQAHGFIYGATMIRLYQVIGLLAISVAVANCAGPSSWLTTAEMQPAPTRLSRADAAFWSTEQQPVGHTHHHPTAEIASAPVTPVTTGLARRDSRASIDAPSSAGDAKPGLRRWSGPEWQAEEQADMERLKRVTNICRC